MKIIFLFFLLALKTLTANASIPSMKCITSGLPTTSFIVNVKDTTVEVRAVNHNGSQFAPVYSGLMTLNDIKYVERSGDFFTKIGSDITIVFSKNKCRFEEDKFYTCSRREKFEINGVSIDGVSFYTTESVDRIPEFEFLRKNVKLSFRSTNEDYNLEMHYYDYDAKGGDCKFE